MSIEKDLARIAAASEEQVRLLNILVSGKADTAAPVAGSDPAPAAPAAPAAPSVPAAPATPPPSAVTLTIEDVNKTLAAEWARIGKTREPIDKILKETFGVVGIQSLEPAQYQQLLDAVKAIPDA